MTVSTDLAAMLATELGELETEIGDFIDLIDSFAAVREYYIGLGNNDDMIDTLRDDRLTIEQMLGDDRAKIEAINLLLGIEPDEANTPTATFTADDAREHDAEQADRQPSDPVKPKVTRKSLRAPLEVHEIMTIRGMAASGQKNYQELADQYGVSRSTIGNIVQKKGCYA